MRILGLTGGIAMGKSSVATILRRAHIPVFDADAAVHALQSRNGAALPAIAAAFPGTVAHGTLDRPALRAQALSDPTALHRLEAILHPMVRNAATRFLARHRRAGAPLAVLEVPLLFESGLDHLTHHVAAVSAPAAIQRVRLHRRGLLTSLQIEAVLARQLPNRQRTRRAHTIIRTTLSRAHTTGIVRALIRTLKS